MGAITNTVNIFTSNAADTVLDSGSYIMPTGYFTVGNIPSYEVFPLTGGINSTPVDYKFTVKPNGNINQGSSIKIVLPTEITVANPATFVTQTGSSLSGFAESAFKVALASD